MNQQKRVLLHICCGICAAEAINKLKQQNYHVVGFYYNPNIYPKEEYLKRKEVLEKVAELLNIQLIIGEYDTSVWFKTCGDYSNEPEGGKRCLLCYKLRLQKTYETAIEQKFDFFTTTLTISPHKNSQKILSIGENIAKERFLKIDFKKNDGFKKTIEFAKQHSLYRQNYCGCIYSIKKVETLI